MNTTNITNYNYLITHIFYSGDVYYIIKLSENNYTQKGAFFYGT